jgi:multidrug efflux pump subunit AcrA (membrane-fusion protein)
VANIDEADSSKIAVGAPATVTLNALPSKQFAAHVIAVASTATVSSNVVEYQVTFALDNTDPTIKPGMTANVSVTTAKADGVLNVSSSAVRSTGGTSYVMVVQPDGTQKQVDVVVGLKGDTTTEVSGALKAGDTVALPASTSTRTTTGTTTTNTRVGGGLGGGGAVFGGGGLGGGRG